MQTKTTLIAAALALALAACSPANEAGAPAANEYGDAAAPATTEPAAEPAPADAAGGIALAAQARVVLQEVQGSGVSGELVFDPDGDALRLSGEVRGLPAGSTHGFHVHETGDCSAPHATSAEHGQWRDRVHDARPEHQRRGAAGMAASLGAGRDHEVAADLLVLDRVHFRTRHRGNLDPSCMCQFDHLPGG